MNTSNEVTKPSGVFIDFCKSLSTSDQQALVRFLGEVNSKDAHAEEMLAACAEGTVSLDSVLAEYRGGCSTNKGTRAVPRKHAELALSEALFRMSAAINQAQTYDPDDPDEAFTLEMLMESANHAASVAIEVSGILGIGVVDMELDTKQCFQDWVDCLHSRGPFLTLEEEEAAA